MKPVTSKLALSRMAAHSLEPGKGYIEHAEPPISPSVPAAVRKNCTPPANTANGAAFLLSPNGLPPLEFTWVASQQVWARAGGNRLAWTPDHLSASGWALIGPAEVQKAAA